MTFRDFSELALSAATHATLKQIGFTEPTPVQQQAIPVALEGRDVIACAATGTGKTAAFVIPMVERLTAQQGLVGLVVAPTRELAIQIATHATPFAKAHHLEVVTIIGGVDLERQLAPLRRANIVVATPGRLVDHLKRGAVSFDDVKVFVLDEADRMLDMGFRPQLTRIVARLPKKRQTMLFSATMAEEVETFAKTALHAPARVEIAKSGTTAAGATQFVYDVGQSEKNALLLALLSDGQDERTVVFCRTRRRADKLAKVLTRERYDVAQMHSDRSQAQRQHALEGFRSGKYQVLVTTDISARGIDVANIGHVINYDAPYTAEDYVHRIGRTARAQTTGKASTFITPEDDSIVKAVEKLTRSKLPKHPTPRTHPIFVKALAEERTRQSNPGMQHKNRPQHQASQQPGKPMGRHARTHQKKRPA